MTPAEWAAELGCTPETIRRAIRRKELLAERSPLGKGLPYQITARNMARFLEDRRTR